MITVRRIKVGESDLYKQIRLTSLQDAPYAFSSTHKSALQRSANSWREQVDNTAQGSDRATFLVFPMIYPLELQHCIELKVILM